MAAALAVGGAVRAEAQSAASSGAASSGAAHLAVSYAHAIFVSSERQPRNPFRRVWTPVDARPRKALRLTWTPVETNPGRRWPLRANPRRWPRLFANTTECALSFNPVLRRHWWD